MEDDGISSWKFIAFIVVTYRRKLSAESKSNNWLTSSEYSNLSEIKLLIPERVFCKRAYKGRVCVHCNCDATNGGIVENVFLNELVLSGRHDECLCQSLQIVVFYRSISQHVHFFCDNHPWEQYDESKVNNPQFQHRHWGCRFSCKIWVLL